MKKVLAILLAAMLTVGMCTGCNSNKPKVEDEPTIAADASDEEIYDYVLGEFYETYQKALDAETVSERFALEAIAEAKMLESGIFMPNTSNGGNYAIGRVVPNTVSSALWGNDSYRYHDMLITTEPIKAKDRDEMKELWKNSADAASYMKDVKEMLKSKGYTIKDTYNYAYSSDPQTWDVLATYMQSDSEPVVNTYDGLLEYDQKNQLQPALAESYTVNDDQTVYTFKIREGVKWVDSQGREVGEVTADDWVAGMQHVMDSMGGLEYLVDGLIVNATEYMDGSVTDFAEVGVKALDKYTLEYTLTDSCSYFLTMLGYGVFAPMNRDYFLSQGGAFGAEEFEAASQSEDYTYAIDNNHIAYCGPYLVTNYTPENTLTFKANETYWNKDNINVKAINWFYNDGQDVTKTYTDMKAGTIDGAGLNSSTIELAKEENLFEDYAYVSATDATAFNAFYNVNRKMFANFTDNTIGVSKQTDEQKDATHKAMLNRHFRRALNYSVDRAAVNALGRGEDLKNKNLINSYVPGTFVTLDEEVTVDINGTATTFPAGTYYGEIIQAQLTADGSHIKAFDPEADGGIGSSAGFDGWFNPEAAKEELKIAIEQLKEQGVEISKENPIHIDYACYEGSEIRKNQGQVYKKSIEETLEGCVVFDIVPYAKGQDYNDATYWPSTGAEMNYDYNTNTGWGPDYGDPKTYLDTLLPTPGGMAKSIGLF